MSFFILISACFFRKTAEVIIRPVVGASFESAGRVTLSPALDILITLCPLLCYYLSCIPFRLTAYIYAMIKAAPKGMPSISNKFVFPVPLKCFPAVCFSSCEPFPWHFVCFCFGSTVSPGKPAGKKAAYQRISARCQALLCRRSFDSAVRDMNVLPRLSAVHNCRYLRDFIRKLSLW